ncbi:HNH homing endonuclease [Shigella phage Sf12]|uniref:HNH homing endonuclease n=1 Tax=Shigella phage Sf12 TaxID=2024315 RepID=A0A291AXP3_9CAUD|nr:HNH endonuclease [Shigella phage Sf12]ATE85740.1 HNH homing endonuclease [Shigella phage Sf12]
MEDWNKHYIYDKGNLIRKTTNSVAGYIDRRGYVRTKVGHKMTFAHRVIWEMHNGEITKGMEIDHLNGIKHDNRIENLRCVDRLVNCKNAAMRKDNKTGQTGVSYNKAKGKYTVQLQKDNHRIHRTFDSFDEAKALAVSFYESNHCFTERHGK